MSSGSKWREKKTNEKEDNGERGDCLLLGKALYGRAASFSPPVRMVSLGGVSWCRRNRWYAIVGTVVARSTVGCFAIATGCTHRAIAGSLLLPIGTVSGVRLVSCTPISIAAAIAT